MARPMHVSDAVVRRLPGYYRNLRELESMGITRISSQELAERTGQTASQIRQDINCFGGFGQQGYGYHVTELKARIGEIMGLNRHYHMVVIGAGNIGRAVANYASFRREGFEVKAMFDCTPALLGVEIQGVLVQPVDRLEEWLGQHKVDIAVLCVPKEAAQGMFDRLVAGGVKAVWNFAPLDLSAPKEVTVVNVHLSDSLQILAFRMREKDLPAQGEP